MIIEKTRIRSIGKHLNHIKEGEDFYISIDNIDQFSQKLLDIGFTKKLVIGEKILPKDIGTITSYNAHGKYKKLKDKPMETAYRQAEWTWEDWHGNSYSKIVDIPYKRYPRKFLPPPSEELTILEVDGKKQLVSRVFKRGEENETTTHVINLFLEVFGRCIILNADFEKFKIPEIKRLNWQILPPGEYPWDEVKEHVKENIKRAPSGNQPVIENRVRSITEHKPNYIAVGKGGFDGYWVFGFPNVGIYILENTTYGNATYVFDDNWTSHSSLSKKEIIDGNLHLERIVHREGWHKNINKFFN